MHLINRYKGSENDWSLILTKAEYQTHQFVVTVSLVQDGAAGVSCSLTAAT